MQTQKVIAELDEFLTANGYYTKATVEEEIDNINASVNTISHTHENRYTGTSETLRQLFIKLKTKEQVGNFSHSKFYELSSNNISFQYTNPGRTSRSVKWLKRYFPLSRKKINI
jgi:hypothetical protein